MIFSIYSLSDPRDGATRYIGITKNTLAERLRGHIKNAKQETVCHRVNWVRSLLAEGLEPVIDLVTETENPDDEIHWIAHFRAQGCNLTNQSTGGEGIYDPNVKDRLKEAGIKRYVSLETRAKISAINSGKPKSPEHRAKLSAAKIGKPTSAEAREKMARSQTGKVATPETCAKLKQNEADRPRDPINRQIALDASQKRSKARHKAFCPWLHALTEANTYITLSGDRVCRECLHLRNKARKVRNAYRTEARRKSREEKARQESS